MGNTRGKTRSASIRLAEAEAAAERLRQKALLESLEDNEDAQVILAPLQDAVNAAQRAVNDSKRFRKIGLEKVQAFQAKAQLWQDRFDDAETELPELQATLAEAKAEYQAGIETFLANMTEGFEEGAEA